MRTGCYLTFMIIDTLKRLLLGSGDHGWKKKIIPKYVWGVVNCYYQTLKGLGDNSLHGVLQTLTRSVALVLEILWQS